MNHLLPKFTLRVTALALTAFACAAASVAQTMAMSTKLEHVIVVDIKDDTTEDERQRIVRSLGGRWIPNSRFSLHDGIFRVFFNGSDRDKKLAILRQHAFVEAADEEHTFTLDPDFSTSASLTASSTSVLRQGPVTLQASKSTENVRPNDPRYHEQWNFQMVGAESAWKHTNGSGVIVAVIDTGVAGIDSSRGRACRDFGTTRFVPGYDFVNNDSQPYDDHGHGTHVAGTIAESTNNAEGVAGLAFGASIMPIKVLSASGSGTSADIAAAICWAVDNGANVINMSLGSPFPDAVIRKACVYASKKNVIIVAAAGNSGKQGVGYPAAYQECIAVSAVGPSGKIAGYSSWGKQVALAAPGGDIGGYAGERNEAAGILQNTNLSPDIGGSGDGYYAFQGTSMASPHVAAAAALIMAQGIKDSAKVRLILTKSAVPSGDAKKYGAGILNVASATNLAAAWLPSVAVESEPFTKPSFLAQIMHRHAAISYPSLFLSGVALLIAAFRLKRPRMRNAWVNFAFSVIASSGFVTLATSLSPSLDVVPVGAICLVALWILMAKTTDNALAAVGAAAGAALTLASGHSIDGLHSGHLCESGGLITGILGVLGALRVFFMERIRE